MAAKKPTSTENKSLTNLIPADSKTKRVMITSDVIHEEEMAEIINTKQSMNADVASSLEAGLDDQDTYVAMVDDGNLAGLGLPADAVQSKPKHAVSPETDDAADDDEIDHRAGLNMDDFVPNYDTDEDLDVAVETADDDSEKPKKKYSDSPKTMGVQVADEHNFLVRHEGHRAEVTKKAKSDSLGDKAFFNALTKVKKQTFSAVTIPFPNSGFFAEVQGGGIIDILQLYRDKFSNTSSLEYDIERMRTMIKGIKSTTPNVDPLQLASNIHQSDYQMLALAYAHATMKTFTVPQTCTSKACHENFNIEVRPIDAITNLDEINEKVALMRGITDYRKASLLNEITTVEMANGCNAELGHPSFLDYLVLINSIKAVAENDEAEGYRYASYIKTVSMIRRIILPGGLQTSNPYQVYKALSLISEADFPVIDNVVIELQKDVIVPEFGIKAVKCPICGHLNTDITIENIDDMVFFHIMATQF